MAQEYFINSRELEGKVRQLLPSQGGAGAGFDLSASTQIIPIIDLTESAEGSDVRADIQSALSLKTVTSFDVTGTTSTLINNTGYFRVFGNTVNKNSSTATTLTSFQLTDGITTKVLWSQELINSATVAYTSSAFDFLVFLEAGHSLTCTVSAFNNCIGCTRQIASIDGVLTNP